MKFTACSGGSVLGNQSFVKSASILTNLAERPAPARIAACYTDRTTAGLRALSSVQRAAWMEIPSDPSSSEECRDTSSCSSSGTERDEETAETDSDLDPATKVDKYMEYRCEYCT